MILYAHRSYGLLYFLNSKSKWAFFIIPADYTREILQTVIRRHLENPAELRRSLQEMVNIIPPPLAANYDHPDLDEALQDYQGRYHEPDVFLMDI